MQCCHRVSLPSCYNAILHLAIFEIYAWGRIVARIVLVSEYNCSSFKVFAFSSSPFSFSPFSRLELSLFFLSFYFLRFLFSFSLRFRIEKDEYQTGSNLKARKHQRGTMLLDEIHLTLHGHWQLFLSTSFAEFFFYFRSAAEVLHASHMKDRYRSIMS